MTEQTTERKAKYFISAPDWHIPEGIKAGEIINIAGQDYWILAQGDNGRYTVAARKAGIPDLKDLEEVVEDARKEEQAIFDYAQQRMDEAMAEVIAKGQKELNMSDFQHVCRATGEIVVIIGVGLGMYWFTGSKILAGLSAVILVFIFEYKGNKRRKMAEAAKQLYGIK